MNKSIGTIILFLLTLGQLQAQNNEGLHETILSEIHKQSETKYKIATEIVKQTDKFIKLCENVRNEMIEKSGGLDTKRNRPKECWNKEIVKKVLLEEGKATVLKNRIIELRAKFISVVDGNQGYIDRITLENIAALSQEKQDSWEVYQFKNLPLCALLPLIAYMKNKAKESEIVVLEYLKD